MNIINKKIKKGGVKMKITHLILMLFIFSFGAASVNASTLFSEFKIQDRIMSDRSFDTVSTDDHFFNYGFLIGWKAFNNIDIEYTYYYGLEEETLFSSFNTDFEVKTYLFGGKYLYPIKNDKIDLFLRAAAGFQEAKLKINTFANKLSQEISEPIGTISIGTQYLSGFRLKPDNKLRFLNNLQFGINFEAGWTISPGLEFNELHGSETNTSVDKDKRLDVKTTNFGTINASGLHLSLNFLIQI